MLTFTMSLLLAFALCASSMPMLWFCMCCALLRHALTSAACRCAVVFWPSGLGAVGCDQGLD